MEKNRFVHYGSVLLIIAAVCAGLLAGVNSMTSGVIANNKKVAAKKARVDVLPEAKSFDESGLKEVENIKFIPGLDANGQIIGYVATAAQGGYGGDISFSLGIDMNGTVTGLKIMNQQETPGLGAKISDENWQKKWIGRDATYQFNKPVDAFAGATISPTAVYTGIIRVLTAFNKEVIK